MWKVLETRVPLEVLESSLSKDGRGSEEDLNGDLHSVGVEAVVDSALFARLDHPGNCLEFACVEEFENGHDCAAVKDFFEGSSVLTPLYPDPPLPVVPFFAFTKLFVYFVAQYSHYSDLARLGGQELSLDLQTRGRNVPKFEKMSRDG